MTKFKVKTLCFMLLTLGPLAMAQGLDDVHRKDYLKDTNLVRNSKEDVIESRAQLAFVRKQSQHDETAFQLTKKLYDRGTITQQAFAVVQLKYAWLQTQVAVAEKDVAVKVGALDIAIALREDHVNNTIGISAFHQKYRKLWLLRCDYAAAQVVVAKAAKNWRDADAKLNAYLRGVQSISERELLESTAAADQAQRELLHRQEREKACHEDFPSITDADLMRKHDL